MARDRTARARVRRLLATEGPVSDSSGFATGMLKERIGYKGTSVAFIQLIAAMENAGEITREIRGKRTYKISATPATLNTFRPAASPHVPDATQPADVAALAPAVSIDYEKLAKALIKELWSAISSVASATTATEGPAGASTAPAAYDEEYALRIEAARNALDDLFQDVEARTKAATSNV